MWARACTARAGRRLRQPTGAACGATCRSAQPAPRAALHQFGVALTRLHHELSVNAQPPLARPSHGQPHGPQLTHARSAFSVPRKSTSVGRVSSSGHSSTSCSCERYGTTPRAMRNARSTRESSRLRGAPTCIVMRGGGASWRGDATDDDANSSDARATCGGHDGPARGRMSYEYSRSRPSRSGRECSGLQCAASHEHSMPKTVKKLGPVAPARGGCARIHEPMASARRASRRAKLAAEVASGWHGSRQ